MGIAKRVRAWWRRSSKYTKMSLGVPLFLVFLAGYTVAVERYVHFSAPSTVAETPAPGQAPGRQVNFTEFMAMAGDHKFKSAVIGRSKVVATTVDGEKVSLNHERWLVDPALPKELNALGIDVGFEDTTPPPPGAASVFSGILSFLVPVAMILLFGGVGVILVMQTRSLVAFGWPKLIRDCDVRFSDVAGQEEPKIELEEIRTFLANPGDYERVGAKPPRGVLLVGPPGNGKTLIAKALAGESGANFISVSGSDFAAMFIGVGRNRVEKLFKLARQKTPCIIFIDEIDSLGRKRGAAATDLSRESDTTLNQLLIEIDGFKPSDGVILVGATNQPELLDPALLRPGRFGRHVHVGLPTLSGRRDILQVHAEGRPLADDVDLQRIACGTAGFSGADLANLVNEASILAAREARSAIDAADFEEARDKVLMGLKRGSLVMDEDEKRLIAYHEGGHALVACKMKESDPVHQATIVPRGRSLGLVMRLPVKDRVIVRRSKLKADLTVLMAGRAAEEVVFGEDHVSNGAASDIEHATDLARNMVTQWGLGTKAGMVKIDDDGVPEVRVEIRRIIEQHYADARRIIVENRDALDVLAQALMLRETIDGDDVRRLVDDASAAAAAIAVSRPAETV